MDSDTVIHYHSSWKVSSSDFIAENFPEYLGKYFIPEVKGPSGPRHLAAAPSRPLDAQPERLGRVTQAEKFRKFKSFQEILKNTVRGKWTHKEEEEQPILVVGYVVIQNYH